MTEEKKDEAIQKSGEETTANVCEEGVVIPSCCGQQMKLGNKIGLFIIAKCYDCGDTVYIKCGGTKKPEMISD